MCRLEPVWVPVLAITALAAELPGGAGARAENGSPREMTKRLATFATVIPFMLGWVVATQGGRSGTRHRARAEVDW